MSKVSEEHLENAQALAEEIRNEMHNVGKTCTVSMFNGMLGQIATSYVLGKTESQMRTMWRDMHELGGEDE